MLGRVIGWWARRGRRAWPQARPRPTRDVLAAERDGLVVLLDLRREVFFGLDEVGTAIWRSIEGGCSIEQLAAVLAEQYAVEYDVILEDTLRFVDELAGRRLVLYA